MLLSLVPRPHPSRERGSGDFAQKPRSLLTFRQEFQTANEIVENSICLYQEREIVENSNSSCNYVYYITPVRFQVIT